MNFLTFLTLVVSYFIYLTYKPYLFDIAIASLMAIAFGKFNHLLYSKKVTNKWVIVIIDTLILSLLIFGPFIYFVIEFSKYIVNFNPDFLNQIILKTKNLLNYIPSSIAEKIKDYITPDKVIEIYNKILPIIGTITKTSAVFIKDAFLIIIFFFFAILYGEKILKFFKRVIPLPDKDLEKLFFNTSEVMSVVLYSTILTALLEGTLFGIIVSFYGMDFFFFSIMYAFSSLIPVIGGIMMWGPVSLYLYSQGNISGAISVAIYSIVVISIIADTFVKPIIISLIKNLFETEMELNSLIIFFSIIAGLSSFGLWGIIIGPAITTLFISILKFYENYNK